MKTDEVTLTAVYHTNASDIYRDGFVAVYQEAFGGPPYFEHYEPEEVIRDVWIPHFDHGIIVIAHDDRQVVGLICAKPLDKAEDDVREFLLEKHAAGVLDVRPDSMWYVSELGVLESRRRRGIGFALIKEQLRLIAERGFPWYAMRTAVEGSNSKHLFERAGAKVIPGAQDVSLSLQVTENLSQSAERIYLYGATTVIHRA
jgi:GNAT superfamily N-acetyltransferase